MTSYEYLDELRRNCDEAIAELRQVYERASRPYYDQLDLIARLRPIQYTLTAEEAGVKMWNERARPGIIGQCAHDTDFPEPPRSPETLISRLRDKASMGGIIPMHDVTINEAANEIERLRGALERVGRIKAFPDAATNLTTISAMREIAWQALGLPDSATEGQ